MPIVNSFSNGSARAYGWTAGGAKKILLSASPAPSATVSTYGSYIVFRFNASGTLNVGAGAPGVADVFAVSGGQSGARGVGPPPDNISGKGGTGGGQATSPGFTITAGTPITVTIGGGGPNANQSHQNGSPSSFGPTVVAPTSGGAAGAPGTRSHSPGISGTPGGTNDYLTGSPQAWAGGGGGGAHSNLNASNSNFTMGGGGGGSAGGGTGGPVVQNSPSGYYTASTGGNAGVNTGGGGGGGGGAHQPIFPNDKNGGAGGSGVVIARFPTAQFTV